MMAALHPPRTPAAAGFDHRLGGLARAIMDPACPVPAGLVGPDGRTSAKRFAVYRNNVVAGLIDVLRAAYPAVTRIVGEAFFAATARVHVAQYPPESPVMLDYGRHFPDFLAAFPPARGLPYLADVARIERAWLEVYHAAEGTSLTAAALAAVAPERVPMLRLALHPALRIVPSDMPALTIWQMNTGGADPAPVDLGRGECALIVRPAAAVEVRAVSRDAARFVRALADGATVHSAVLEGLADSPRFDPAAALGGLLDLGLIVGLDRAGAGS